MIILTDSSSRSPNAAHSECQLEHPEEYQTTLLWICAIIAQEWEKMVQMVYRSILVLETKLVEKSICSIASQVLVKEFDWNWLKTNSIYPMRTARTVNDLSKDIDNILECFLFQREFECLYLEPKVDFQRVISGGWAHLKRINYVIWIFRLKELLSTLLSMNPVVFKKCYCPVCARRVEYFQISFILKVLLWSVLERLLNKKQKTNCRFCFARLKKFFQFPFEFFYSICLTSRNSLVRIWWK